MPMTRQGQQQTFQIWTRDLCAYLYTARVFVWWRTLTTATKCFPKPWRERFHLPKRKKKEVKTIQEISVTDLTFGGGKEVFLHSVFTCPPPPSTKSKRCFDVDKPACTLNHYQHKHLINTSLNCLLPKMAQKLRILEKKKKKKSIWFRMEIQKGETHLIDIEWLLWATFWQGSTCGCIRTDSCARSNSNPIQVRIFFFFFK